MNRGDIGATGITEQLEGKGPGELLEKEFSLPRIASDLIRQAVKQGTRLGEQARAYVAQGELVPDELVTELVKERLAAPDTEAGFILDGFPRTLTQAQSLAEYLAAQNRGAVTALFLALDEEVLLHRLTGRRFCPRCGTSFHLTGRPPKREGICDACGGQLEQRPDDTETVIVTVCGISSGNGTGAGFYADKVAPAGRWKQGSRGYFFRLQAVLGKRL